MHAGIFKKKSKRFGNLSDNKVTATAIESLFLQSKLASLDKNDLRDSKRQELFENP